jgi:hypothetical protein
MVGRLESATGRGLSDRVLKPLHRPTVPATDPEIALLTAAACASVEVIEQLMRQIMHHDGEFRREEATSAAGSHAMH